MTELMHLLPLKKHFITYSVQNDSTIMLSIEALNEKEAKKFGKLILKKAHG